MSYPYLARTTLKYKSPHATDLSFAKDETIRVTGPSDDDEDWLVGETLDGSKAGGFPKDFIVAIEETSTQTAEPVMDSAQVPPTQPEPVLATQEPANSAPPIPVTAPAPPSPKITPTPLPPPTPASPANPPQPSTPSEPVSPSKLSIKDRLAFFAAAQSKPAPPPIKPKPATGGLTWSQRQKLRQEQESKGETVPAPPAVESVQPVKVEEKVDSDPGAGLSAADAQNSISKGGSLKERMAALRAGGAFGSGGGEEEKATPPKAPGKVWMRPTAPEPDPEAEGDAAEGEIRPQPAGVEEVTQPEGEHGEEGEDDEEAIEKARRAAIAARMAKLGARGPMGMAPTPPPKPTRKPTSDGNTASSPVVERSDPIPTPFAITQPGETAQPPAEITAAPTTVPLPSIPRRTAPPRRKPVAPTSVPEPTRDDTLSPPPQVMVADEEQPLPKTDEQLGLERQQEDLGRGLGGADGAKAAGIALLPSGNDGGFDESRIQSLGAASSDDGAAVSVVNDRGAATLGSQDEAADQGVMEEDGTEDDIMGDAQRGELEYEGAGHQTDQPEMVALQSPAEETEEQLEAEQEDEDSPPPPPPRALGGLGGISGIMPKDEIEMKHEREAEEEGVPPPPRLGLGEKPSGPRPLPSPARGALPPPPSGGLVPPRDDEDERELEGRGDEDDDEQEEQDEPAPPPPPRRQPTLPTPLNITSPSNASESPKVSSPAVPRVPQSPAAIASSPTQMLGNLSTPVEEEDDKSRRSGIAARMAKLGGVKFGVPPPVPRKQSGLGSAPTSPVREMREPQMQMAEAPLGSPSPVVERSEDAAMGGAETPEAEATRRRATLARLRAGGALGFGMFNHGPASPSQEDTRGLGEQEGDEAEGSSGMTSRPPAPSGRPMPPTPVHEEEILPPPVPSGRPLPTPDLEEDDGDDAPPPPPRPMQSPPTSPIRSTSSRPPIPTQQSSTRGPLPLPENQVPPPQQSSDWNIQEEPARLAMNQSLDFNNSSPSPISRAPPPIQTEMPEHRRSMSSASHLSTGSGGGFSPATRQGSRTQELSESGGGGSGRQSMQGNRPGFADLQGASKDFGGRLARAAKGMFEGGKKGYYGDGSPSGFVLVAMDNAKIPRPENTWGQVVYEQEGSSVLKRHDEPRAGDVAAFYDARFKGRKGLQSYEQHVGSVEEALVGVIVEFEGKGKHKIRVLQVERGVPEEVSYRCDDLKSGRILVHRVGL